MTDDLEAAVEDLQKRVSALEARLDEQDESPSGTVDQYDAAVLEQLEEGEVYRPDELRSAYKNAGIRNTETLKDRLQHLTETYCERVAARRWEFLGGGEDV